MRCVCEHFWISVGVGWWNGGLRDFWDVWDTKICEKIQIALSDR